jgi:hypothetical protein
MLVDYAFAFIKIILDNKFVLLSKEQMLIIIILIEIYSSNIANRIVSFGFLFLSLGWEGIWKIRHVIKIQ